MVRRSALRLAVVALTASAGLAVPGVVHAADAPEYLYVDNRNGSGCSNGGTGTADQPYCTVGAAAAVVVPGQTVLIAGSVYPEQLNVTRSGTPDNPITFTVNPAASGSGVMLEADGGISVTGQHDVTFSSIGVYVGSGIAITDSSRITLRSVTEEIDDADAAGVRLAGVSDSTLTGVTVMDNGHAGISLDAGTTGVTIESSKIMGNGRGDQPGAGVEISGSSDKVIDSTVDTNGVGIAVEDGASGTVLADNIVTESVTAAIDNDGADGTAVTGNTVRQNCTGILVRGTSTGTSVENNVSLDNDSLPPGCTTSTPDQVDIGVYDAATSSTTVDYNLSYTSFTEAGTYAWGTPVASLAAFQAASGQGANDINATPKVDPFTNVPEEGSPAIDSADSTAPGEQDADIHGNLPENDPAVPDTGRGPVAYRDRGAIELTGAPTASLALTPIVPSATSGWKVTADASASTLWSPASAYTFDFGDGTVVTQSTPVATHAYGQPGSHTVTLTVKDAAGLSGSTSKVAKVGGTFTSVGPVRVLDTRGRIGVSTTTPVAPFSTLSLTVAGVSGVPASGVAAVVLNVTAAQPTASGFLTVYPDGQARPGTSNVDWVPGAPVPNLVTVPVVDGKVDFYNGSSGTVHVLADLFGYYGTGAGAIYFQDGPTRILDTRAQIGVPSTTAVAPGATVSLTVGGVAGVPIAGAAMDAVLNVTVTQPTASGFLTVYPDGRARPGTSNLNWSTGQTIANLVTVPMVDGKVDFYNGSSGTVHVLADLAGYYSVNLDGDSDAGGLYEPAKPTRVLDTRTGTGTGSVKPIAPGGSVTLSLAGYPVNYLTGTNNGVLLNVTATDPATSGFLTVYPGGQPRPVTSVLDWAKGQTIANLVSVPVPTSGTIVLYNGGGGTVDVIADLVGSYQN